MTIDEAIKHAREVAEENRKQHKTGCLGHIEEYYDAKQRAEEQGQLAEWLEELKRLRQATEQDIYERAYAEGRDKGYSCGEFNSYNKAIDEACLKIYNYLLSENDFDRLFCEDWEALAEAFKEIAQQLKAGDTNGNSTTDT